MTVDGVSTETLQPDLAETGAYITSRVSVAGGTASKLFTREAVITIHERSQGIPRIISVICHNALISAFALNQQPVRADTVLEVCRDFDLKSPSLLKSPVSPQMTTTSVGRDPKPRGGPVPVPEKRSGDMFVGVVKPKRWFSVF